MNFQTTWQPITRLDETSDATEHQQANSSGKLEVRHILAIASIIAIVFAPIAWALSGEWASGSLLIGVGVLLISVAGILAPSNR